MPSHSCLKRFHTCSNRFNLRLVFGSRIHLVAAYYDQSSAIEEEIGESDEDIEARRVFVEFGGVVYRQLEFKTQFNSTGTSTTTRA